MTAFLISGGSSARFERSDLADGFSESWLQELLFREPDLLPLSDIDSAAGRFIPVCRELSLPRTAGSVFVDLFGVTPTGRPVLIECKLWRNPQARREVIAQILEYAALLRGLSYSDLTAKLKAKLGWTGENPLYAHAASNGCRLSEATFTDSVARNLRSGDFYLIVAGDGIREDAAAIAEHIGDNGTRLAMVEFQRWRDLSGNQLVVPLVPFRTVVVRQRILVDAAGMALHFGPEDQLAAADVEQALDPEKNAIKEMNRAFWQSFIEQARFDHPDQPPPRHGGNNWAKITLPSPARWITAYRSNGRAGLNLVEEPGSGLIEWLARDAPSLQQEFGNDPLRWRDLHDPGAAVLSVDQPQGADDQLDWLEDATNRLVSALRPRLADFEHAR